MENKKDILIFLSDQHDGRIMHCAGHPVVRTPHLDALAAEGTLFENAYTSCPLCVPARMSLLSGMMPMHTGVYTNKGSLHPETPTFLHSLALEGYETVLCGRMHFEGDDQRHGFTKRIAGDITPTAIGGRSDPSQNLGEFSPTLTEVGCLQMVGGGNSPTLEYDRYVTKKALEYLSEPHDAPQCLVVGTYGPHFPYLAPPELYEYYQARSELPPTLDLTVDTPYRKRLRDTDPAIVKAAQAAYWGMIEFEDTCIGQVHDAWKNWLSKNEREGIFFYLSDHGDHAGDRGFYGKQSLYEASVRIPLIASGDGIRKGQRIHSPVSILDIAPTVCALAGAAPLPGSEGIDLSGSLQDGLENTERSVITEWISNPYAQGTEYGRMIRRGEWKYISYVDYPEQDKLFCPEKDFWETQNLLADHTEWANELHTLAFSGVDAAEIVRRKNLRDAGYNMLARFNRMHDKKNTEMWTVTDACRELPTHILRSSIPLPPMFRKNNGK